MMANTKIMDITGRKYGRLTAVKHLGKNQGGRHHWLCECECGNTTNSVTALLNAGKVRSCGCLASELSSERTSKLMTKHGNCTRKNRTPEYDAWRSMVKRCTNKNTKQYKDYGGRGISVCAEWLGSFETFLSDMGSRPSPDMSLDRIDNDGNYEPVNCRWADKVTQMNNRRNSLSCKGDTV